MACTAPGQDPPPRPMCLRSWETHQSRRLWPQPQVLASAVGWERLISNFLGTRSSVLGLSYNLYALGQGQQNLKGQMVNILDSWALSLSQLFNSAFMLQHESSQTMHK